MKKQYDTPMALTTVFEKDVITSSGVIEMPEVDL